MVSLNRAEAIATLKELISEDLIDPSYLGICSADPSHCQIQIRSNNKKALEKHASKQGLTIVEDKEQEYLIIYKK